MTGTVRRIAAFDFDGTLTRHDTLVPFLARVAGRGGLLRSAARIGIDGLRRRVPLGDRDRVKELMISDLLGGRSEDELRTLGAEFAVEIMANRMNHGVLERLHEHLGADHEVILVSASLVYYLDPIAEELGLDAVIAVEPTVVGGVLDGTLLRPNVRAEQKAIRLREWLENTDVAPTAGDVPDRPATPRKGTVELWAYGNSSGDLALLDEADHGFWLGRPGKVPSGSVVFEPGPLPN